jgi:hypothetical protein
MSFENTRLFRVIRNLKTISFGPDELSLANESPSVRAVRLIGKVDQLFDDDTAPDYVTDAFVELAVAALTDLHEGRSTAIAAIFAFAEQTALRLALPSATRRPATRNTLTYVLADCWSNTDNEDASDRYLMRLIRLVSNHNEAKLTGDAIRHRVASMPRLERQYFTISRLLGSVKRHQEADLPLLAIAVRSVATAIEHLLVSQMDDEQKERWFLLMPTISRLPRAAFNAIMVEVHKYDRFLGLEDKLREQIATMNEAPFDLCGFDAAVELEDGQPRYVFRLFAGIGSAITDDALEDWARLAFATFVPRHIDAVVHLKETGSDRHRSVTKK